MPELYQHSDTELLSNLQVDRTTGLDSATVAARLQQYGPNELQGKPIKSPWKILWEQLTSVMVVILIVAAALSAVMQDWSDAIVILAIVIFFSVLGVFQEYRAEKAIAALKEMAVPHVRVRRNGQILDISARDLVPGDLILVEAGTILPADCRWLEAANLKVQEAALTGEAEAIEKHAQAIADDGLPLGDRRNMGYMGTTVTYGRGLGVVVGTGMQTELGKIATLLDSVADAQTPLQRRLDQLGKTLAIVAVAISAVIMGLGLLRGEELRLMIMSAISVAVAAVPEGLPAVLTITLAFGSQRMLKRHALVRKLTGIETLGSVSVICSDKTGTLTQNLMRVTHVVVPGHDFPLAEASAQHDGVRLLLTAAALCNDGQYDGSEAVGDPTETALLVAAHKLGLHKAALEEQMPRLDELPFDSERKRMSTRHQTPPDFAVGGPVLFCKGSVDGLLAETQFRWHNAESVPLTANDRADILAANNRLAQEGLRVLGVACRPEAPDTQEHDLVWLGLVGMMDPPRPEVADAVKQCQAAGIRAVMITGDHPLTARRIAQDLGIATNDKVVTGQELETMPAAELQRIVEQVSVFARVSPEHKLRIVEAFQAQGRVIAMTGDGVNDAPALKKANIGVAMGITGTDVSKEAADMVLQDDNFATIVAAVEEGRIIYDNLRKFIAFSVAGNLGKILVMLGAPLLGMPLALLPIQMLWLNLMTDGLLGLGIGVEKAERNIMAHPPVDPGESILGGDFRLRIVTMGLMVGGFSLGLGAWSFFQHGLHGPWQTVLFTALAVAQIWQALAVRSSLDSVFQIGFLSNRTLAGLIAAVALLQVGVVYVPFLQTFFHIQPLTWQDFGLVVGVTSLILWITEVRKWLTKG
jgi:Ca2+-transporting ATPase